MSGYLIFNINVKDPEGYKEYLNKVTPIAESFGGKYIVRAGEYQVLEGEWKFPRTVVIKFPSYDKAIDLVIKTIGQIWDFNKIKLGLSFK